MLEVSMTVRVPRTDNNIIGRFDQDHYIRVCLAKNSGMLKNNGSRHVPDHHLEYRIFQNKKTGKRYQCLLCTRVWVRTGYMIQVVMAPEAGSSNSMLQRELAVSETHGALYEQGIEDEFRLKYEDVTSDAERMCAAGDAAWTSHSTASEAHMQRDR